MSKVNNPNQSKKEKRQITAKEKVLVAITLVFLVVLIVKSIYFDPYKAKPEDQIDKVDQYISQTYDSFLYDSGFLKIRLVDYKALETGEIQMHLRKYILGILPFGDAYGDVK